MKKIPFKTYKKVKQSSKVYLGRISVKSLHGSIWIHAVCYMPYDIGLNILRINVVNLFSVSKMETMWALHPICLYPMTEYNVNISFVEKKWYYKLLDVGFWNAQCNSFPESGKSRNYAEMSPMENKMYKNR